VVVIAWVVGALSPPPLKSVSAIYGLAAVPPQLIAMTVVPPVVELLLLELDELELLLELDELLELELLLLELELELELLELELPPGFWISIPSNSDWFTTEVQTMTIWPLLLALVENCWIVAIYSPPAVLKMSKAASTCVPLIETLNVRSPAAPK